MIRSLPSVRSYLVTAFTGVVALGSVACSHPDCTQGTLLEKYNAGVTKAQGEAASATERGTHDGQFNGSHLTPAQGQADGTDAGYRAGYAQTYQGAYNNGYNQGLDLGRRAGGTSSITCDNGNRDGFGTGTVDGQAVGTHDGYNTGLVDGHDDGIVDGDNYCAAAAAPARADTSTDTEDEAICRADGYNSIPTAGVYDRAYAIAFDAAKRLNTDYQNAFSAASTAAVPNGRADGTSRGDSAGRAAGYTDGFAAASQALYTQCYNQSYGPGYTTGYNAAYGPAYTGGYNTAYADTYNGIINACTNGSNGSGSNGSGRSMERGTPVACDATTSAPTWACISQLTGLDKELALLRLTVSIPHPMPHIVTAATIAQINAQVELMKSQLEADLRSEARAAQAATHTPRAARQ